MYIERGVVEQAAYSTRDVSRPVRHSTPTLLHSTHQGQGLSQNLQNVSIIYCIF